MTTTNSINKLAEIQVYYSTQNTNKEKINSVQTAYEFLLNSWDLGTLELQEEFKVILLNRANEALGIYSLSKGGITGTVVDVRLLFAVALNAMLVVSLSLITTHLAIQNQVMLILF